MIKINKNTFDGDSFIVYAIKNNKIDILKQFILFLSENKENINYLEDAFHYIKLLPCMDIAYLLNLCKENEVMIDKSLENDGLFKRCLLEDFSCDKFICGTFFTTVDCLIIGKNFKSLSKLSPQHDKDILLSFIQFNLLEKIKQQFNHTDVFKLFTKFELEFITSIVKYNRIDIFKYFLNEINLPFNLELMLTMGCKEGNQEMVFYLINNFHLLNIEYEKSLPYCYGNNLDLCKTFNSLFKLNRDNALTVLSFALKNGKHNIVEYIHNEVPNLNLTFNQPVYNSLTILYILQQNLCNNNLIFNALFNIVETGNLELFNFFCQFNDNNIFIEKNEKKENLLFSCCKSSSVESLKIFDYLYKTKRLSICDKNSDGFNLLEYAILHNNLTLINTYLNDFKTINNTSVCTLICEKGYLELFKIFYDINEKKDINSILQTAIKFGNINIYNHLLLNIDIPIYLETNIHNYSLLHYAAMSGNIELFKSIYQLKHNLLNTKGENEETPIFCAIEYGRFDLFKYICETFPITMNDKNSLKSNILHFAFLCKQKEIIEYLLKLNIFNLKELNLDKRTPILVGAASGFFLQLDIIKPYLETDRIVKDKTGNSLLHYACKYNQQDYIAFILKNFTNNDLLFERNHKGLSSLHYLAKSNIDAEFIFSILNSYTCFEQSVNDRKDTFIHIVIQKNNIELLSQLLLLEKDFFITNIIFTKTNEYTLTPFETAIKFGHANIIKLIYDSNYEAVIQMLNVNYNNLLSKKDHPKNLALDVIKIVLDLGEELKTYNSSTEIKTESTKKRNSFAHNESEIKDTALDEHSRNYKRLFNRIENNDIDALDSIAIRKIIEVIDIWKNRIIDGEAINWSFSRLQKWLNFSIKELVNEVKDDNPIFEKIIISIKDILHNDLDNSKSWSQISTKLIYFFICNIVLDRDITEYLNKSLDNLEISRLIISELVKIFNGAIKFVHLLKDTVVNTFNIERLFFYEIIIEEQALLEKTLFFDNTEASKVFKEILNCNDNIALKQFLKKYFINDFKFTIIDNNISLIINSHIHKLTFSNDKIVILINNCEGFDIPIIEKLFPKELTHYILEEENSTYLITKYSNFIKMNRKLLMELFRKAMLCNNLEIMNKICFIESQVVNMEVLSDRPLIFDLIEQNNIEMIKYLLVKNCDINLTVNEKNIYDFIDSKEVLNLLLQYVHGNENEIVKLCIERGWDDEAMLFINKSTTIGLKKDALLHALKNRRKQLVSKLMINGVCLDSIPGDIDNDIRKLYETLFGSLFCN
ncbi:hypothetical protein ABK040_005557 [Willaertia magna]